jgi:hypothetical protein
MIRSTKAQLKEFKESLIWKDIKDELVTLFERAQVEYDLVGRSITKDDGTKEIPNSAQTLIHLGDIQGRRTAVSYFIEIPDILIGILEDEKDDTER